MTEPRKRGRGRPFQKGVSGNPNGRPKSRLIEFIQAELAKPAEEGGKDTKEQRIATKLVDDAVAGDQEARVMLFNRVLGKVPETLTLEGESLFPHLTDAELMKKFGMAVAANGFRKPSGGA